MHELSIMEGVLEMVRESARQNDINKINKLKLVIGKLTMIMPDSLAFAFEVLSQEDMFRGARLEIEEVPALIKCKTCNSESIQEDPYCFACLACGSNQVDIVKGREMYLDYYEGDRV
ncbi:MAG: hydrogenase maturation nickel metallochaperone HypA [Syntrophomonadaceae bacterium]